jgi:hypothetical protein
MQSPCRGHRINDRNTRVLECPSTRIHVSYPAQCVIVWTNTYSVLALKRVEVWCAQQIAYVEVTCAEEDFAVFLGRGLIHVMDAISMHHTGHSFVLCPVCAT